MPTIKYFAFDTETTGIDDDAQIISLAYRCLAPDLSTVSEGVFYAHPADDVEVSPGAAAVNGYTREGWDARGATTQEVFREQVATFLQTSGLTRALPLGHNVPFDLGKLKRSVPASVFSKALAYHFVDTMCLAISLDQARGVHDARYNLAVLCTRYGVPLDNAHDAISDITATIALYKVLIGFLGGDVAAAPPLPAAISGFLEKTAAGFVFAYGKHKGKTPDDVPPDYRAWALREIKHLSGEQRAALGDRA